MTIHDDDDDGGAAVSHPRNWAGLTHQGTLLISIDKLRGGTMIDDVVAHESVHEVLLKNTQVGLAQRALGFVALEPWPDGPLRRHCAELLALSLDASRYTHEACATFVPGIGRTGSELERYRAQYPADYLAAAGQLDWLHARELDDDVKQACAYTVAAVALAVPVLEDWQGARLHDADAAARFWSNPTRRPDRRFPVLCDRLRTIPTADLHAVVEGGVSAMVELLGNVRIGGRSMPITPFDPDTWTPSGLSSLFRRVNGRWLSEMPLSPSERNDLQFALEKPWLALNTTPTDMAVLMTPTRAVDGSFADNPPVEILDGYAFVKVVYNTGEGLIPGIEPIGKPPWRLSPGDAALWLSSPGRMPRACHLRANAFRTFLERLSDDTTLAVHDGAYFFGLDIGEPRLLARRHIVLVQNRTPRAVADVVATTGLDQQGGPVLVTHALSDIPGVSYLLLRPVSRPFPLVIVPTGTGTAMLTKDYLMAEGGSINIQFVATPEEFFGTDGDLVFIDLDRVIHEFEGTPWEAELMPRDRQPQRARQGLIATALQNLRRSSSSR
jgi:hypothetical protein